MHIINMYQTIKYLENICNRLREKEKPEVPKCQMLAANILKYPLLLHFYLKTGSHCRSDQPDQTRSCGRGLIELDRREWSGRSSLFGITRASFPIIFRHVKNIRVEVEQQTAWEAIENESRISRVGIGSVE